MSPVTLRTWDSRYGLGPARRSPGGQRRYSDADVGLLEEVRRLTAEGMRVREAASSALASRHRPSDTEQPSTLRQAVADAADRLDVATLTAVLDQSLGGLGPGAAWESVVRPVLSELGERWAHAHRCQAAEWALVEAVSGALERFEADLSPLSGIPVVIACAPDEWHSLPPRVLAAVLACREVPTVYLGPAVPAEVVETAVRVLRPPAVVVWSLRSRPVPDPVGDSLADLPAEVVLAGPGWCDTDGQRHVDGLEDAVAAVATRFASGGAG